MSAIFSDDVFTLVLDGGSLSWREVELVLAGEPMRVELSDVARTHMSAVRDLSLIHI